MGVSCLQSTWSDSVVEIRDYRSSERERDEGREATELRRVATVFILRELGFRVLSILQLGQVTPRGF